jgi:NADPH:quinone reductase-like Zn-dependent oxidoreductase
MKALRIHEFGGPDKVLWEEIPRAPIGPGKLRLAVRAGALNHLDHWVREGIPGIPVDLPMIQGSDVAGEVIELGAGVSDFALGDRLALMPLFGCGQCKFCLKGDIHICPDHGFYGETCDGNFADEIVRPQENFFKLPDNLSYEEGAAITLVSVTAWEMLLVKAKIQEGESLLVLGASSGVGSMAIQIGKLKGARVLAITSGEENCKKALALGADEAIDRLVFPEFAKEVKARNNNQSMDVIFEHTGAATFEQSQRCLGHGGRMVICGATTGHELKIDVRFLFVKQWQILGSSMGSPSLIPEIYSHFASGALKAVIGHSLPMSEGAEAQRLLVQNRFFGKIVLSNEEGEK